MPRRWTGTWQVLRKDLKTESVSLVHHNEASCRAAEAADVDFLTVLYVGGQGAGRAGPFRASVLGVFSPCRHAVDPPCESVTNLLLFLQDSSHTGPSWPRLTLTASLKILSPNTVPFGSAGG